jgi:AraC-like DNA-binding protein
MSPSGQIPIKPHPALGSIAFVTYGMPRGSRFLPHTHAEHQLTWASTGLLTVEAQGSIWVLPSTQALWIPSTVEHALNARVPATLHGLYFRSTPVPWTTPTVVTVNGLLRELILHLEGADLPVEERLRAEAVLFDLLTPVDVQVVTVPMPADDRALAVAGLLLADPADGRSLAEFGRVAGASSRTLARLFTEETGMTFGDWRAQVRLRAALELLATGMPVSTVAGRVGFSTASAFTAMFRRLTGATPRAYADG